MNTIAELNRLMSATKAKHPDAKQMLATKDDRMPAGKWMVLAITEGDQTYMLFFDIKKPLHPGDLTNFFMDAIRPKGCIAFRATHLPSGEKLIGGISADAISQLPDEL